MKIIKLDQDFSKDLKSLPSNPGVYKFLNKSKVQIYIGKAKNIKNRVSSYFLRKDLEANKKLSALMSEVKYLDLAITNSEEEALILEQHLIRTNKPKFNVQFKDDKGYPWIKLELKKDYPSANYYLGKKNKDDTLYGPFPSRSSVRESLLLIQKTFKLRNCSDNFFNTRSRPCLQYEIGRCSAPCDNRISRDDYRSSVQLATQLLEGKGNIVIQELYDLMDASSDLKEYEKAALCRDQINSLRDIQRKQSITGFKEDRDAVVIFEGLKKKYIGVTQVRGGWITSHHSFYIEENSSFEEDIIEGFMMHHYLNLDYCPSKIILEHKTQNLAALKKALSIHHKKKIEVIYKLGKKDKGLLEISKSNTKLNKTNQKNITNLGPLFNKLPLELGIKNKIARIECYDISHSSGNTPVGSCVVFGEGGKIKSDYRLYNISKSLGGNDIASMKELVRRRFKNKNSNLLNPDLIIVDGGKAQLNAVKTILNSMSLSSIVTLGISKGKNRKAENDILHIQNKSPILVNSSSKVHKFLQSIRDEAHRFAVENIRLKRKKGLKYSSLELIGGIGLSRKNALLRYFGSIERIKNASPSELGEVPNIGEEIALNIYNTFKK
ncbi:MAG: excinuclease ABC subunit UvrC [SAR86 cluster bacterium]|jgi:excinuclease ABC subunit C|nr:excinuclease ABC subunit UvrC [SAR86 cluster bacterium]